MKYTNYYSSPLGKLLMAADDIGLTVFGLKISYTTPTILIRSIKKKSCLSSIRRSNGLTFIFLDKPLISLRLFI